MKKTFICILLLLLPLLTYSQENKSSADSLFVNLSSRIDELDATVKGLRQSQARLSGEIEKATKEIAAIESNVSELGSKVSNNENAISGVEESVSTRLDESAKSYQKGHDNLSLSIQNRTLVGCAIVILLILLCIIMYLLLRKRIAKGADATETIRLAQENLQEESLKLDGKLLEIFDTQMKIQKESSVQTGVGEPNHSLALKVADELVRIETNLSRMDANVRGYKQLSASLRRIKDNYIANGYEIVDMLGKPYHEGMKVIANFVPDDSLKEGEQLITGVVKPQINYKGQMIQAAQITVSQN